MRAASNNETQVDPLDSTTITSTIIVITTLKSESRVLCQLIASELLMSHHYRR